MERGERLSGWERWNLLSHTSGLPEYESPDRTGPGGPFYLRLDFSEEELVKRVEALPVEWAPGEKWDYRNTNYPLLGIIDGKISTFVTLPNREYE